MGQTVERAVLDQACDAAMRRVVAERLGIGDDQTGLDWFTQVFNNVPDDILAVRLEELGFQRVQPETVMLVAVDEKPGNMSVRSDPGGAISVVVNFSE